jgi:hypothetical protein
LVAAILVIELCTATRAAAIPIDAGKLLADAVSLTVALVVRGTGIPIAAKCGTIRPRSLSDGRVAYMALIARVVAVVIVAHAVYEAAAGVHLARCGAAAAILADLAGQGASVHLGILLIAGIKPVHIPIGSALLVGLVILGLARWTCATV